MSFLRDSHWNSWKKFYVSVINLGFSIRPLLFLIYINDIIDGLESTPLFMLMTLLYLRS